MTVKKRILQATFDEAVQENIDTFSMPPEEAVKAAVDEFEMQGVDLANIIKTPSGGDLQEHPIMLATKALQEATGRSDFAQAEESLRQLNQLVSPEGQAELPAVVVACGTVPAVIASAETLRSGSPAVLQLCLAVLAHCLASDDSRAAFAEADGAALLHRVLSGQPGNEVVGTAAAAARAAATRDEANKKAMVKSQVADDLVGQIGIMQLPANVAAECCRALRAVTTMDDPRPIAPETFNHARHIAAAGAAPALLELLRRDGTRLRHRCFCAGVVDANLAEAALSALRPVAANDQICQEIAEAGGVDLVMAMFSKPESPLPLPVVRAAVALLRQLAGSDANKRQIVASGGLELALRLVREQPEELKLVEQAMGLLSSLMLRNPEVALQAYELGCDDVMLDVLQDANITAPVARQTSQAVRMLVSRNPDLRTVLREKEFGPALKAVRKRHFAACRDVASAAMRDLGMDDYNVMEAL